MFATILSLLSLLFIATPTTERASVDHSAWDVLLQKHVSTSGVVDYAAFKKDQAKLDAYLSSLAKQVPNSNWSRGEQMAYWINIYNAYTVKLIVKNYPTASITKLEGGKPWDKKWIKVGTKTYSLNQVENEILRPQFKDARIHFAVNCAAKSCPPLLNQAWTASNLEAKLEKQAKAFINNTKYNKLSKSAIQVSKIFEWYAEDFGKLPSYLNNYANQEISYNTKVSYLTYDWALNGK